MKKVVKKVVNKIVVDSEERKAAVKSLINLQDYLCNNSDDMTDAEIERELAVIDAELARYADEDAAAARSLADGVDELAGMR